MKSGNPVLKESIFAEQSATIQPGMGVMTVQGAVNKTFMLLALTLLTASITWQMGAAAMPLAIGGAIGGLIVAIATSFKPTWAKFGGPAYALLEGLFLGAFSSILEAKFPGIVIQAVSLTLAVLGSMLMLYKTGMIKATAGFKKGVMAATGGIMLVYVASFILGFFGIQIPMIHSSGMFGIGFSLFVVGIAALNLVLDFDFIESSAEQGAPQYMEWYAAFSLLVTLVWLYIEILRLLAKLQSD